MSQEVRATPIKLGPSHRYYSPHALQQLLRDLRVHLFQAVLVVGLRTPDDLYYGAAGLLLGFLGGDVLLQVELDVALLEVVVVHTDVAGDCRAIVDIDGPGGGPLTAPEILEIQVVA